MVPTNWKQPTFRTLWVIPCGTDKMTNALLQHEQNSSSTSLFDLSVVLVVSLRGTSLLHTNF
jgi:hypothetical protein